MAEKGQKVSFVDWVCRLAQPAVIEKFRALLVEVKDLERTFSRLSLGSGNARDLIGLRLALEQFEGASNPAGHRAGLPRVRNYHVATREYSDQLVFLRKLQPGATDKSHGLQVARLASVPRPVSFSCASPAPAPPDGPEPLAFVVSDRILQVKHDE